MKQYHNLVENVLSTGNFKQNRTGVATISGFSEHYKINLQNGFPLLTTKDMSGYRWESLIHELFWYLSGENHIKNLREKTKIWDAWADSNGRLDTAYGRFWRRYPIPEKQNQLPGESWPDKTNKEWVSKESITTPSGTERTQTTFDQLQYVIDMLRDSPQSRRLVINAWHPANAAVSTLPPCHYTFVFNVQGNTLNCHLTQRSGDIALGIPFNIAAYSILTQIIAQEVNLKLGTFSHTIVDAHIYCGTDERSEWYKNNLSELQQKLSDPNLNVHKIEKWLETEFSNIPNKNRFDHVPNLLAQIQRDPRNRPTLNIENKPLDDLDYEDIELSEYNPHPGLKFGVAE